jgi:hypothetical protein
MIGRMIDGMVMWDWLMILLGVVALVAVIVLVVQAMVLVPGKPR